MTDFGYLLISILFFNFALPWFVVDLTYKPLTKVGGLISIFPIWLIKVAAAVAFAQMWRAGDEGFWLAGIVAAISLCLMVHLGARVLIGLKTNRLHAMWLTLGPPFVIIWFVLQIVAKAPPTVTAKSNVEEDGGRGFESDHLTVPLEESYLRAFMAIEYRPDVKAAWEKAQGYDLSAKNQFLRSLESNPKLEVDALLMQVTRSYEARINPFQDEELNAAYKEALRISEAAASEFKAVIETLGDSINAREALQKIKLKHENPEGFWIAPMG